MRLIFGTIRRVDVRKRRRDPSGCMATNLRLRRPLGRWRRFGPPPRRRGVRGPLLPGSVAGQQFFHGHWGWEIEVGFDELKTHLAERTTTNRAVLFRSLRPSRVEQELYGLFIAHNLVRTLMHRAATKARLCERRISFVAARERVREAIQAMMVLSAHRLLDRYQRMIAAMILVLVPLRPGRSNPREVKIKMFSYPCTVSRCVA